jgi:hypothetical protein
LNVRLPALWCAAFALGCGAQGGCGPRKTSWIGADFPSLGGDAGAHDGGVLEPVDAGTQIDPALLPPGAPNDSIFLYWLLDDDDLTVAVDASGQARLGTLDKAPSLSDPAPTARANNRRGRFFNATGERVHYQGDALPGAFTAAMWLRPALASSASIFARTAGPPNLTLELAVAAGGGFELRTGGQTQDGACTPAALCAVSSTRVTADLWVHLALSVDETGRARLFVNGSEEASVQSPRLATQADLLEWAASSQSSRPGLRGLLDELIVYTRPLTGAEIASLAARK